MTEDTRRWATANASTPAQLASGITDFRVAQRWEKEAHRKEQGSAQVESQDDTANPRHKEDFDRLLGGMAKSSE